MTIETINTDVLIIGGGTAGCYAALTLARADESINITIVEKANIKRSGCLAAGVNAINAYITAGRRPEDYADYMASDAEGIVRDDLCLSIAKRFNTVTADLEKLGLVILKDENGEYVTRGNRNIKINGENIKPILANSLKQYNNITVLNHVQITDYLVTNISAPDNHVSADVEKYGVSDKRIAGAVGFATTEEKSYVFYTDRVICSTGGAAGLYRPNNPGFSRHKMWYPPFNTGAGYAMGIRAGAEMTTLEMRFIALRCKDTIAPTGTIAQGVGAKQTNSLGEVYETKYGIKTYERLYGTVTENREGRGPCYLDTTKINSEQESSLLKAYLNMAPSQTLRWLESGASPSDNPVEVEGTEPYIVGGHTASGYWVDVGRRTTISGLYAAGDVAGGAPQKYVTGALAEGEIAALSVIEDMDSADKSDINIIKQQAEDIVSGYDTHLRSDTRTLDIGQVEEAMQKVMDEYAGGIGCDYRYSKASLEIAEKRIINLESVIESLPAEDMDDLMRIYEIRERLTVCRALIAHLGDRCETRWKSFAEYTDYPEPDDKYELYVNSKLENNNIKIIHRDLVKRGDKELVFR